MAAEDAAKQVRSLQTATAKAQDEAEAAAAEAQRQLAAAQMQARTAGLQAQAHGLEEELGRARKGEARAPLSLIHISEPTRPY